MIERDMDVMEDELEEITVAATPSDDAEADVEVIDEETVDEPVAEEAPVTEDESAEVDKVYKPQVAKRIKQLLAERKQSRDELMSLRAKTQEMSARMQAVEKQRNDSIALAKQALARQNELAEQMNRLQGSWKTEAVDNRKAKLEALQRDYMAARESQDVAKESQIAAQMAALAADAHQVQNWQPQQYQQFEIPNELFQAPEPQAPAAPQIGPVTLYWASTNEKWFGQPGFEAQTQYAAQAESHYISQGYDRNSPDLYRMVDAELDKKFPGLRSGAAPTPAGPRRVMTPAVGGQRVSSAQQTTRVALSPEEKAMCARFGLPEKEYARTKLMDAKEKTIA